MTTATTRPTNAKTRTFFTVPLYKEPLEVVASSRIEWIWVYCAHMAKSLVKVKMQASVKKVKKKNRAIKKGSAKLKTS